MNEIDFYTNVSRLGNNIVIRGIKDGKEVRTKTKYEPTIYIEHQNDYGFKSLYGKNLKPVNFDTMRELKEFTEQHKGSNLKLYGYPHHHSQFCLENFQNSVEKFDKSNIRVYNIDIEVTSSAGFPEADKAEYPVTALCLYDSVADKFITFGLGEWNQDESILPESIVDKVVYVECESEVKLFERFMKYWQQFPPNIITGWNIEGFDIPYIINRASNLGFDTRKFSPWGIVDVKVVHQQTGDRSVVKMLGIDILDYMPLYKKNKVQDSYRLDNIAKVELGEQKSLGTVEMLDMSRTPFTEKPSNTIYELTNDEEFNRFARVRKERVDILNSNNPNKDLESQVLLKQEKQVAFQAFISYNIQDVNLVKRLDEKLGLLDTQIMIAYEACMNYEEVQSPVRTWDCLINKEMFNNNQRPHYSVGSSEQGASIPGGYVKEPHVGKHGWCASFDLNSLYPHLIMQFNISPETLDQDYRLWPYDQEEQRVRKMLSGEKVEIDPKYSTGAAGYRFNNEFEGIIPRLMRKMYNDRKAYKKEMIRKQKAGQDATLDHLKQLVLKLLLNSGYGALVNQYFRWFDRRMGMSITLSGQYLIQVAERSLNQWMNKVVGTDNVDYVIAIDTDSNYLNLQPLVDKFFPNKSQSELVDIIDKISEEQITPVLEKGFAEAAKYLNCYDQKMVMEREAIASSAFWTAKKRYAMCVWDMEGVRMPADKPKLKIQGLEAIRSSTPYICRQPLLNIIEKTLLEDEEHVQQYIANFKAQFLEFDMKDIGMPRSMNNLNKYSGTAVVKGIPIHARGALTFNRMLEHHNLQNVWEPIQSGEKGKFCYLMLPNSVNSNVISFTTDVPKEFDVERYVDKHTMFEKIISDPAKNILEPIGWSVEKKLTLDDFFG